MNGLRLEYKFFSLFLFSCIIIFAVLWITQSLLFRGMFEHIRKRHLENAATLIEKNIDSPDLSIIMDNLSQSRKIFVVCTPSFEQLPDTLYLTREYTMQNGQVVSLTLYTATALTSAILPAIRANICIAVIIVLPMLLVLSGIIAKNSPLKPTENDSNPHASSVDAVQLELIANISHDLRTPLALIHSYAEMMHDFPDEITPQQTLTIMNETTRLTSIINELLDFSRMENDSPKLNISYFNLTQSINDVVIRISEFVKKDGYILLYEHDGDAYVSADEAKIIRAFYNLLTNAIKYSGTDKTVLIRQIVSGGYAKIEVADKGLGIAPECLPYVWNKYYSENKATRLSMSSTGLGLSIAKKIIDLHGGQCGVKSELGKGSEFWFAIETCNKIAYCGNNTS